MPSQRERTAHRSITELHKWIEDVFTGRPGHAESLEKVLASLSDSFTMVAIGGQVVGCSRVEMLFRQHAGGRPALRIVIDKCETLLNSAEGVLCRYRETHFLDGKSTSRWSVAMIEVIEGQPRWRFLQETAIAV